MRTATATGLPQQLSSPRDISYGPKRDVARVNRGRITATEIPKTFGEETLMAEVECLYTMVY